MTSTETTSPSAARLPLIDALRAVAASLIAWHHIGLYGPLAEIETPHTDLLLHVANDFRWAVQVFLVVGGYVTASSLANKSWTIAWLLRFAVRRYCRLALPYVASLVVVMFVCAAARGWVPDEVAGSPPTWQQFAAHALLVQGILGYESLAAGVWFVSIDYQLGLLLAGLLFARVRLTSWLGARGAQGIALVAGWMLAALGLFVFNLDDRWEVWAVYFWGQFFFGVVTYQAQRDGASSTPFTLYGLMMVAAMAYVWRWRLAVTLATGLAIYWADRTGLAQRWPTSRTVAYLGRTSYSLFLIHYPVLVAISALWAWLGGDSEPTAALASFVAYLASLLAADAFYRVVELPALRLSRWFA